MINKYVELVEKQNLKSDIPEFHVGDNVDVHTKIKEGEKERTQVFSGVVIQFNGRGLTRTFTVRRIVTNEGVERIFPLNSPNVLKVVVKRKGQARRAKLFFLRDRVGKSTKLSERRNHLGTAVAADATAGTSNA